MLPLANNAAVIASSPSWAVTAEKVSADSKNAKRFRKEKKKQDFRSCM